MKLERPFPGLQNLSELFRLARHLEFRAVSRWVMFGLLVGLTTGGLAALMYLAADGVRHLVFVAGVGLHPPTPKGEPAFFAGGYHFTGLRYWLLVTAPAIGAMLCGLILHYLCPEARGGAEGYIEAFHSPKPQFPRRLPLTKLIASALFLGFGNSAGREGPIAHICAAVGARFGQVFRLSDRDRRLLLVAGVAGGIGAIFRTPLGGALFAVEVLYRDDFESEALVPAVLSSVVAYSTFTFIFGEGAMFFVAPEFPFDPRQLPLYLLMAMGCAVVGVLFVWSLRGSSELFGKVRLWFPLKMAIGGLCVGILAIGTPVLAQTMGLAESADDMLGAPVLGAGYGWLQEVLLPTGKLPLGWSGIGLMLVLALAKVAATSVSHGSGGAGGAFGPSVVIGGMVGGAFGLAFHSWFPDVVPEPTAFAIVGMACFVGGVTHSPISTLVMASEMTGNYELLVPIMLAEAVTVALMHRWTQYSAQVANRRHSPAHVEDYALAALERLTVQDAASMGAEVRCVPAAMSIPDLLRIGSDLESAIVCVQTEDQRPAGIINLDSLRSAYFDEYAGVAAVAVDCASPFATVAPTDTLAKALEKLTQSRLPQLPVCPAGAPDTFVGLLHFQNILDAYSKELRR